MADVAHTGREIAAPAGKVLLWIGAAAAVAVMCILPVVLSPYWLRIATSILMYCVLAQGLNVIVGFAGYHAFGNVVWFGVGAYVAAICLTAGVWLPVALVAAVVVAAALAFVIGWPLLRLTGHYFAIATVALSLAAIEIVLNLDEWTGGASGVSLPISPLPPGTFYQLIYFLMLGAALISIATVAWLSRSSLGYALRALKDSEKGAQVMGVNTRLAKMLAWSISGSLTGLAGAIWSYWMTFIEPGTAFDVSITIKAYIMMVIGGMGSIVGPVLGAVFLEFISVFIWGQFLKVHMLVLGLLIIAVVMFFPHGLLLHLKRLSGMLWRAPR